MLAFADWWSTGTHYLVRYFSDLALPELHSNSITAISFTTDIWTSNISMRSLTAQWVVKDFLLRKAVLHAHECAGSHTAAAISMAFENMFETWRHKHTPSSIRATDWRNKLINCVCSRRDTLCHGIDTPGRQNCRHRLWTRDSVEFSNVSPPYKALYLDADKQGLHEMLDTVTVLTEEERPRTDRAETSLLGTYDEIWVKNAMTEQRNSTANKWKK